jgi:hypothetical protein
MAPYFGHNLPFGSMNALGAAYRRGVESARLPPVAGPKALLGAKAWM